MRILTIIFLLIILTFFALGSTLKDSPEVDAISIFDNATISIQNITLDSNSSSYLANSVIEITEQYVRFIGTFIFESSKFMISFGRENPEHFEPLFIIKIVKLILWLVIISLLIKPLFYLGIFVIMGIIWISEKIKGKRKESRI